MGKIRNPQYRIVVADARKKRDGRAIENLGIYHPKEEPSRIEVNSERVQYWLSVGAQPSDPVLAILRKTGDWQKFKGLPPPAKALKTAAPRVDQKAIYDAEAKAAAGLADKPGKGEAAPTKKAAKKGARKAAAKPADSPEAAKADTAEAAKADAAKSAEGTEAAAAEAAPAAAAPEPAADKPGATSGEQA
jgi:small subunit ribosomal protein S16